jgi:CheY-like chemotaxis protein
VNQRLARTILEKQGHSVTLAQNGREALARCQMEEFDVVLMDVQMPEMDGLEATAAIRELESKTGAHVPIVGVTAHAMKGDRERCLGAGMDGYVSKPIRPDALFSAIDAVIERRAPEESDSVPLANGVVLDEAALLALVSNDWEVVRDVATAFVEDSPLRLDDMTAAFEAGDATGVRDAAHTLKGSAGSLCGRRAADAALRVEQLAQDGDLQAAREAAVALRSEVAQLKQALTRLAARAA